MNRYMNMVFALTSGKFFRRVWVVTFVAILALLYGCNSGNNSGSNSGHNSGHNAELVVLFTNDMHSSANYPALYTLIEQQREEARKRGDALILVDGGDIAMGSIFQTIYSQVGFEYLTMGKMGYDAYALGNHDFDFGVEALEQMFENSALNAALDSIRLPQLLIANLSVREPVEGVLANLRDTMIIRRDLLTEDGQSRQIKIGLFGLIGKSAFSNIIFPEKLILEDAKSAARRAVEALQAEGVDYIVAISHSGTKEDTALAKKVDGIDVIVSAHDHHRVDNPIIVNGTVLGSAGAMGEYLGKIRIGKDGLESYDLIPVSEDITPDDTLQVWVDGHYRRVKEHIFSTCGVDIDDTIAFNPSTLNLNTLPDGELLIASHIAKSYSMAVKELYKDSLKNLVSVAPYGVLRDSLMSGFVTYKSAFNVLSLGVRDGDKPGFPLVVAWLKGSELKDLCELNATIAPHISSVRLFFDGMKYTYNRHGLPFLRVKEVYVDGKPVEKDSLYPVAIGLYAARLISLLSSSSFGILQAEAKYRSGERVSELDDIIVPVAEWLAFAEYIKKNGLETSLERCSIDVSTRTIYLLYAGLFIFLLIILRLLFRKL